MLKTNFREKKSLRKTLLGGKRRRLSKHELMFAEQLSYADWSCAGFQRTWQSRGKRETVIYCQTSEIIGGRGLLLKCVTLLNVFEGNQSRNHQFHKTIFQLNFFSANSKEVVRKNPDRDFQEKKKTVYIKIQSFISEQDSMAEVIFVQV